MDNIGYTTLTRQSGLLKDISTVAQNMANMGTTGYRAEGVIFSEYVHNLDGTGPSVSMGHGAVRTTDFAQGTVFMTGGTYDLAIEGEGFFMIDTAQGQALTRAGSFIRNDFGELVTPDGSTFPPSGSHMMQRMPS